MYVDTGDGGYVSAFGIKDENIFEVNIPRNNEIILMRRFLVLL